VPFRQDSRGSSRPLPSILFVVPPTPRPKRAVAAYDLEGSQQSVILNMECGEGDWKIRSRKDMLFASPLKANALGGSGQLGGMSPRYGK
jgi:hypothetical protein